MYNLIQVLTILVVAEISLGENFMADLNTRLDLFKECNVKITAEFEKTDWLPHGVPVTLFSPIQTKKMLYTRFGPWKSIFKPNLVIGFVFRFRETKCALDLIFHLSNEDFAYDDYRPNWYQDYEYMNDKYLVYVQNHTQYLSENLSTMWGKTIDIVDHRIFIWTVVLAFSGPGRLNQLVFQDVFFMCQACDKSLTQFASFGLESECLYSNLRSQMDITVVNIRRLIFWRKKPKVSYRKLPHSIALPFDESNIGREPDPNIYQFIVELINLSNVSVNHIVNRIQTDDRWARVAVYEQNPVPYETDGFNFYTCHTSDTFWSTAKLFWRPFQLSVWGGLCLCMVTNGVFLAGVKFLSTVNFYVPRFCTFIVLNLIEVGVQVSRILGQTTSTWILVAIWLLTSLVLTNSYKGLIISYLSVPWAPEQEWEYFHQMKDFKFYAALNERDSNYFWRICPIMPEDTNISCHHYFLTISTFGYHAYNYIIKSTALVPMSFDNIFVLPLNETDVFLKQLFHGDKLALVSYNSEIDRILMNLKDMNKRVTIFRGLENLWSHNKYWMFRKISYSQPQAVLVQFISSGIHQFWMYWLRDRKQKQHSLMTEGGSGPVPLSLGSNIFFVFVILIIGLVVSSMAVFTESIAKYMPRLKRLCIRQITSYTQNTPTYVCILKNSFSIFLRGQSR